MKALRLLALAVLVVFLSGCTDSLMQPATGAITPTPAGPAPQESFAIQQVEPTQTPSALTLQIVEQPTALAAGAVTALTTIPPLTPVATSTGEMGELVIPSPTVAAAEAPTATLAAQLQGTVVAQVPPTLTPDVTGMSPFSGIDGVRVVRLHGLSSGDYWVAYSTGSRSSLGQEQKPQRHFVAAYEHTADTWREVSRVELDSPDFLSEGGVSQVEVEPSKAWLAVESGAGAHGGCYDVLSFDGKTLTSEVSHCASSPGAGRLEDVNGDGQDEIVLNDSDNYVLCYACGVRLIKWRVLRWNGERLVEAAVEHLPVSAPGELRKLNDRAVDLFHSELVKDAVAAIDEAVQHSPSNQTVAWNRAIIRLHAEARAQHTKESGYPLLARVFCGDYAAAVEQMRTYSVADIFSVDSPLLVGTPADDWRPELVQWITSTTTQAISAQPDLAPAYFLRGWALHLSEPDGPGALRDLEKAADIYPADTLFAESVAYLRQFSGRSR